MNACLLLTLAVALGQNPHGKFQLVNLKGLTQSTNEISSETLKSSEFREFRSPLIALPQYPRSSGVLLANGDYFCGSILDGNNKSVSWKTNWGELDIPLTAILGFWFEESSEFAAERALWNLDPPRGDRLHIRGGDLVRGTLLSVDAKHLRWKPSDGGATKVYSNSVPAHVLLDPKSSKVKIPNTPYFRMVTERGDRLAIQNPTVSAGELHGTTLFGAKVQIPLVQIVSCQVANGRIVELMELKPVELIERPFNQLTWPMKMNRTVENRPLTLKTAKGVETFDRGLGTHSGTTVAYELPKNAVTFQTLVGLDAVRGQRGCVDIRILLDGKPHAWPAGKGLKFGPAHELSIPVENVRKMTLEIDFGSGGDIQDVVNWTNPIVITK